MTRNDFIIKAVGEKWSSDLEKWNDPKTLIHEAEKLADELEKNEYKFTKERGGK